MREFRPPIALALGNRYVQLQRGISMVVLKRVLCRNRDSGLLDTGIGRAVRVTVYLQAAHATPTLRRRRSSATGQARRPFILIGRSGPSSRQAQPLAVCGLRPRCRHITAVVTCVRVSRCSGMKSGGALSALVQWTSVGVLRIEVPTGSLELRGSSTLTIVCSGTKIGNARYAMRKWARTTNSFA